MSEIEQLGLSAEEELRPRDRGHSAGGMWIEGCWCSPLEVASGTSPTAKAILARSKEQRGVELDLECLLVALCEEIDELKAAHKRGLG